MEEKGRLTRNDVSGIHRILVFDEAKAVHQLDLGDFSGAMSRKVSLDIGLGSCRESESVGIQRGEESYKRWYGLWTSARKVAQVEPRGRDLSHVGGRQAGRQAGQQR